jgi:hypothetical protein
MTVVKEIVAELVGMFVGEKLLTIALLIVITLAWCLADFTGLDRLVGGAVLLSGCLILLVESVCRGARAGVPRPVSEPANATFQTRA